MILREPAQRDVDRVLELGEILGGDVGEDAQLRCFVDEGSVGHVEERDDRACRLAHDAIDRLERRRRVLADDHERDVGPLRWRDLPDPGEFAGDRDDRVVQRREPLLGRERIAIALAYSLDGPEPTWSSFAPGLGNARSA